MAYLGLWHNHTFLNRRATMSVTPDRLTLLVELEARQEEALRQLVELDERLEAVLRDVAPSISQVSNGKCEAARAPGDPAASKASAPKDKAA